MSETACLFSDIPEYGFSGECECYCDEVEESLAIFLESVDEWRYPPPYKAIESSEERCMPFEIKVDDEYIDSLVKKLEGISQAKNKRERQRELEIAHQRTKELKRKEECEAKAKGRAVFQLLSCYISRVFVISLVDKMAKYYKLRCEKHKRDRDFERIRISGELIFFTEGGNMRGVVSKENRSHLYFSSMENGKIKIDKKDVRFRSPFIFSREELKVLQIKCDLFKEYTL